MTRRELRIRGFQCPRCPPRPLNWNPTSPTILLHNDQPQDRLAKNLNCAQIFKQYHCCFCLHFSKYRIVKQYFCLISTAFQIQKFHRWLTALIEFFQIHVKEIQWTALRNCNCLFHHYPREWRKAGNHLNLSWKKVAQRNKSRQLILPPKLEAIPSPCQMLGKKVENLNCRHMLAPYPPNWTKHLHFQTATLCHVNTLLIW